MNRQEIINKIEYDNNRINLYNCVLPIILGILDKYNGKQYTNMATPPGQITPPLQSTPDMPPWLRRE